MRPPIGRFFAVILIGLGSCILFIVGHQPTLISASVAHQFTNLLNPPVNFTQLKTRQPVAFSANPTCALIDGRAINCWHRNVSLQLGHANTSWLTTLLYGGLDTPTPTPTFGPTSTFTPIPPPTATSTPPPPPTATSTFTPIPTPTPVAAQPGALIIVAGRFSNNDQLQTNLHNVANTTYQLFRQYGYSDEQIYYLATDAALAGYDAAATSENLRLAITSWALDKVGTNRPLTLYLVGYGGTEVFYVDNVNDQRLTPTDLNLWLSQLEVAVTGVESNVVIEAAFAGTFIDGAGATTISKAGRVIITATAADAVAFASATGAVFSDEFLTRLGPHISLQTAFILARQVVVASHSSQQPWLDADGNGIPNQLADEEIAAQRALFSDLPPFTPTPTSTPTPTATATETPTATTTATDTPTATTTATATTTSTATATRPTVAVGDSYEEDDTCERAQLITNDGVVQTHTFHQQADADWVKVNVVAGATYQIDVLVPEPSTADVQLQLFDQCEGSATPHDALGPGLRLRLNPTSDSVYYLNLRNYDPDVAGTDVTYQLFVRKIETEPQPGAVILVGGRLRVNDELQPNIYEATNRVYQLFARHGYPPERIFYLTNDPSQNPDNNAQTQDVDGLANRERLRYAITEWAADASLGLGPERALTLYLMDHGAYDKFFLNGRNETVGPDELDQWLTALETARPGVKVNVMIDACLSGSFIDAGKSLSKAGRVVITSASNNANAYPARDGGTVFTNAFVQALDGDTSLFGAYAEARAVGLAWPFAQSVWLDDNGNGVANEASDGQVAQQRGFAFAGSLAPTWDAEPPYIAWVQSPATIENRRGEIRTLVRTASVNLDVWAVIYDPAYNPPPPSETLPVDQSRATIRLEDLDKDGIYSGIFAGFDQPGNYRIVVYAVDDDQLQSRPKQLFFPFGSRLFLPMIAR